MSLCHKLWLFTPVALQLDFVRYFKLFCYLSLSKFEIYKVYAIRLLICRDQKNWVCGKKPTLHSQNTVSFYSFVIFKSLYIDISKKFNCLYFTCLNSTGWHFWEIISMISIHVQALLKFKSILLRTGQCTFSARHRRWWTAFVTSSDSRDSGKDSTVCFRSSISVWGTLLSFANVVVKS